MKLSFTKMQGAGNDFVVIDATRRPVDLTRDQWRWLAHRQFGVGADQILVVELPTPAQIVAAGPAGLDFVYRIVNADGGEVEQCGNGARCFVQFVRERGLTSMQSIRVLTRSGIITPRLRTDGRIEVDMGAPSFDLDAVSFSSKGLTARREGDAQLWPISIETVDAACESGSGEENIRWVEVVSMGNPHAVQIVPAAAAVPVAVEGPVIERHPRFARRVNAGFMEITSRTRVNLRVYERGAGETLACGTGACAAVVSGIHRGLLDHNVEVRTRGGPLTIQWDSRDDASAPVLMTGPATTVFAAEVVVPDTPLLP